MFLEIEGDVWINVMMIQSCTMRHSKKRADVLVGGQLFESYLAYTYLTANAAGLKVA